MLRTLLPLLFCTSVAFAQEKENQSFHFQAGLELRVTPIYLKPVPNVIIAPDRNNLPQEGDHLGGWAFVYSIEKDISKEWSAAFTQQIRYDHLYFPIALNIQQSPDPYFRTDEKKAIISDLRLDVYRNLSTHWKVGLGLGMGGLGSRYLLTERFRDNNGGYFLVTTEENYIHPFASVSIACRGKRLEMYLRANYTNQFPGFFHGKEFIQPVLGVQYRLFSF